MFRSFFRLEFDIYLNKPINLGEKCPFSNLDFVKVNFKIVYSVQFLGKPIKNNVEITLDCDQSKRGVFRQAKGRSAREDKIW